MILDRKEKQPIEVKDYPIDYADWLSEAGETLTNVTHQVVCMDDAADTSLAVVGAQLSPSAVSLRLSGGTDGRRYKVIVTVTTSSGQIDQSEFIVKIKDY